MARIVRGVFIFLALNLVSMFMFVCAAAAQISNVTNTTSTPIQGTGHDYIKLLSETVNPANGSVSVRIALPTAKSRGITLPFSIAYDSNGVRHLEPALYPNFGSVVWKNDNGYLAQGGWSYSIPLLNLDQWNETTCVVTGFDGSNPICTYYDCWYSSGYIFRDASGSRHDMATSSQYVNDPMAAQYCHGIPSNGGGDGQLLGSLTSNRGDGTYNPLPFVVSGHDGTVYYFDGTASVPGGTLPTSFILPTYIKDRMATR